MIIIVASSGMLGNYPEAGRQVIGYENKWSLYEDDAFDATSLDIFGHV
jgi:hypothetical protein